MSAEELMTRALENGHRGMAALDSAALIGHSRPVPAELFERARRHLTDALAAATELERLARGGTPPQRG